MLDYDNNFQNTLLLLFSLSLLDRIYDDATLQGVYKMDEEQLICTIIAGAGEAKSSAMEAINYAKNKQFKEADKAIKTAYDSFIEIHKIQTDMIVKEANGVKHPMSLLMVHAQDHLMTTMLFLDLAKEFIDVYRHM